LITAQPVLEITACEVCGADHPASVLDLGTHPLCDDLIPIGDARVCREFPIEILYCPQCRTAHQRFQVAKQTLFPATYHYRARFTADVLNGMAGLVESVERRHGAVRGRTVLDIGCNDGSLLGIFRGRGAVTLGIEPTGAGADAGAAGHRVYHAFLDEEIARHVVGEHGTPDLITMTNVFAHISNLPQVLASLRILSGPATRIVIENHYLGAILAGNQFDTFYHEHPRSYSQASFQAIAGMLGRCVTGVEFPSRYGGNIRVFLGAAGDPAPDAAADVAAEADFAAGFALMRARMARWRTAMAARIAALVQQHGPLRAKAFPGRAAILIRLLGLDVSSIRAVHEKPGSLKIGHYVPGTRIPILSDDDLVASGDIARPLLNLAWHIPREIRLYLGGLGYRGEIIDIVSPGDAT